jgi:hypothetical protein
VALRLHFSVPMSTGEPKERPRSPEERTANLPAFQATELTTPDLLKEIAHQAQLLAGKQIALAKAEIIADLRDEAAMVEGVGLGALVVLLAINTLLVSGILALGRLFPGWLAGLMVTGALLVIATVAALAGWRRRVRVPLARTRRSLREDMRWTKEKLT